MNKYTSPSKKELDLGLGLGLDLSRAEGRSYKDDSNGLVTIQYSILLLCIIFNILFQIEYKRI